MKGRCALPAILYDMRQAIIDYLRKPLGLRARAEVDQINETSTLSAMLSKVPSVWH